MSPFKTFHYYTKEGIDMVYESLGFKNLCDCCDANYNLLKSLGENEELLVIVCVQFVNDPFTKRIKILFDGLDRFIHFQGGLVC